MFMEFFSMNGKEFSLLQKCLILVQILFICSNAFIVPHPSNIQSFKSSSVRFEAKQLLRTPASLEKEQVPVNNAIELNNGEEVQNFSSPKKKEFFLKTLWDFTRPHTLIGSALCIPAIHFYAKPLGSNFSLIRLIHSIAFAAVPSLLMNLYITGLNQITDVKIDRISKPYLPIASGQLSKSMAILIVSLSLISSIALGWANPVFCTPALRATLIGSALLGTSYSLPPLRLKRFPSLAAFCIIVVRGALINVGFYAHALQAAYKTTELPSLLRLPFADLKCGLLTAYFAIFGVVIALMKDVPDVEGDRENDIKSFSVRFGQARMFKLGRRLMSLLVWFSGLGFLGGASWVSKQNPELAVLRAVLGVVCIIVGASVQEKASKVKPEDSKQVYNFYMFLWKVFYGSYLFLPFAK
mmetsp:Transcript_12012/g.15180  ORF Transcript_12012/g.15180 Transcript_12012/m.15180 type:complete len:411 (-) Transcript_12012:166-1398(-)